MKNDIFSLKAGDTVTYKGTGPFWFTDMIQNAKNYLTKGKTYTVSSKKIFSSWVMITLKETGEVMYALHWFNMADDTTHHECSGCGYLIPKEFEYCGWCKGDLG